MTKRVLSILMKRLILFKYQTFLTIVNIFTEHPCVRTNFLVSSGKENKNKKTGKRKSQIIIQLREEFASVVPGISPFVEVVVAA